VDNRYLLVMLIVMPIMLAIAIPLMIWSLRHDRRVLFEQPYGRLLEALNKAKASYGQDMAALEQMGFKTQRRQQVGDKHLLFDHDKGLTALMEYHIDDRFVKLTYRERGQLLLYLQRPSYYTRMVVFPYGRIVECVLLQDETVVRSSHGSALLAGTSVPTLGLLQGQARSDSRQSESGILAVRLTLDDRDVPAVLIGFADGVLAKDSEVYAIAFKQAQEVFGIFDGMVRINRKEKVERPVDDGIFEKVRQLGKLRDEGLLSEEEFEQRKTALMEKL